MEDSALEFDQLFAHAFEHDDEGMSQDPLCMYDHLGELVKHFESPSAVKFFRSTDARSENSKPRALLESGRDWANQMKEDELARVLFASIIIGGGTLHKYLKVMED